MAKKKKRTKPEISTAEKTFAKRSKKKVNVTNNVDRIKDDARRLNQSVEMSPQSKEVARRNDLRIKRSMNLRTKQ